MPILRVLSALRGTRALQCSTSKYLSRSLAVPSSQLKHTGLYDFHVQNSAKMVPFAGYSMPLVYENLGQVASHQHVRESAGLFDVGHMVQTKIHGPTAVAFLEWLTPSSLSSLSPFSSTLSVLLNKSGGIIDDLIITKHSDTDFYVVTNAGRRDHDLAWFAERLNEWNAGERSKGEPVVVEEMKDWGLVALQGPQAASYLQKLTSFDLKQLTFGKSTFLNLDKHHLHVARGGYTGEDGFEISIPPEETLEVAKLLTQNPVELIGLGARDSLRLEAGMCLYGNDLHEDTSPVEAGLSWVIGKDRREKGDFIGAEVVLRHLKDGPPRRRVGIIIDDVPARQGAIIYSGSEEEIGIVTSGIPSPTLKKNIAMGYVKNGFHKRGTEIAVKVRGSLRRAQVAPMPFVPTKYWRG